MADTGRFFEAMATAVAGGANVRAAAKTAGCGERTAYRLSSSPEFRHRVSAIRSEIAAATVGQLTQGATQAASTLVALLDESQQPAIRLNAAKAILASLAPMSELGELRARLDALEKASGPKIATMPAA